MRLLRVLCVILSLQQEAQVGSYAHFCPSSDDIVYIILFIPFLTLIAKLIVAGIMALCATSSYYDSTEIAARILPNVVVLTIDPDRLSCF